jgi:hypothetical protein
MAVSMFSTPEYWQRLQESKSKIETAIREAQIAKQAGIPGADNMLATAEAAQASVLRMLATYFPGGAISNQ